MLMIRWLASRMESAATTWLTLKEGFRGTCRPEGTVNTHAIRFSAIRIEVDLLV